MRHGAVLRKHTAMQAGLGYVPGYCPACIGRWYSLEKGHVLHERCENILKLLFGGWNASIPSQPEVRSGDGAPAPDPVG